MSHGKGINSWIGFGAEVTPGTKGVIDLFARLVDNSLKHQKDLFAPESQSPDWHNSMYYTAGRNVGSLVFEQTYTGLELWWHALMGTYTFTLNAPVASTNTHAFSFVPATNNHPAISGEAIRGIGGAKELSYLGLRPTKATVEFGPRKLMRTTFDLFGLGYSRAAATAPTFPTFRPVVPAHKATLTANGTAISVLSGRVEIEVPRSEDREHYGEAVYKDGVVIDRPRAKFQFEMEFGDESGIDSDALLQLYEAGTKLSGVAMTHGGDIITGATKYGFNILASGGYVEEATPTTVGNKITGVTVSGTLTDGVTTTMINATAQVT